MTIISESSLCEVVVLPKGFARPGWLRATLALAPHPQFPAWKLNFTDQIRSVHQIELHARNAAGIESKIATITLDQSLRDLLSPKLWEGLFQGSRPSKQGELRASSGIPAAFSSGQAVRTLHTHANSLLNEHLEQSAESAAETDATRRHTGIRVSTLRARARSAAQTADAVPRGGHAKWLTTSMQEIHELMRPPGDHIDDLVDDLRQGAADNEIVVNDDTSDDDKLLSQLLAAHGSDKMFAAAVRRHDFGDNRLWQSLHAIGVRYRFKTLSDLRSSMKQAFAIATAAPGAKSAAPKPLATVMRETLLLKAAHVASGDTSAEAAIASNRLAAIGLEFGLHPLLGLALDVEVPIDDATLKSVLGSGGASLAATFPRGLGVQFQRAWTAVTAAGTVRSNRASIDAIRFREDGWCEMPDGFLSNFELPTNTQHVLGTMLDSHNKSDVAVRGVVGAHATMTIPHLQTGPVVLHVDGLAEWRTSAHGRSAALAQDESTYVLEDLVVGLRPRLGVRSDVGHAPLLANLLARTVRYAGLAAQCDQDAVRALDPSREEGLIALHRASSPGDASTGSPTLTMDDQLFEWNGWNPSVPMPGTAPGLPEADLLRKSIAVLPGSNAPYRYGMVVEAACRWVLRDGSSSGSNAGAVPVVTTGALLTGTTDRGLPLLRYEPIKAPQSMFENVHAGGLLQSKQTADHVVLGGPRDLPLLAERAVRWVLPGALRDIFELGRHGVFDDGTLPTATAYRDFERAPDDSLGQIFPVVEDASGCEQPVFQRASGTTLQSALQAYHPDPLAVSLHAMIVRQTRSGDWRRVYDEQRRPLEATLALYGGGHRWPDAAAWRLAFDARRRDGRLPTMHPSGDGRLGRLEIDVPAGERFSVMIFGQGDPTELVRKHAFYAANSPGALAFDCPLLAKALLIDVAHVVERPFEPALLSCTPQERSANSPVLELWLAFEADAGSTSQIDLHARWRDPVDDPKRGRPIAATDSAAPASAMIVQSLTKQLGDAIEKQLVDKASNRLLRPAARADKVAAVHSLPDTRRRTIRYFLRATGDTTLSTTDGALRPGAATHVDSPESAPIDVPATAAPLAPVVREVVPAFEFVRTEALGASTSERETALTVILERGWWNSGPGELLAVMVAPKAQRDDAGLMVKPVSTWGADPLRKGSAGSAGRWMTLANLKTSSQRREDVVADAPGEPTSACYEPRFDAGLDAWCVDVLIDAQGVPQPFVQLVLARYQPEALAQAHWSPTAVVDFIQLPSHRHACVRVDPEEGWVTVIITGPMGRGSAESGRVELAMQLQHRASAGLGATVWQNVGDRLTWEPTSDRSEHRLKLDPGWQRGVVRVCIEERAIFKTGNEAPLPITCHGPMHYFDALELDLIEWPFSPN
jgi:hypothetical protein